MPRGPGGGPAPRGHGGGLAGPGLGQGLLLPGPGPPMFGGGGGEGGGPSPGGAAGAKAREAPRENLAEAADGLHTQLASDPALGLHYVQEHALNSVERAVKSVGGLHRLQAGLAGAVEGMALARQDLGTVAGKVPAVAAIENSALRIREALAALHQRQRRESINNALSRVRSPSLFSSPASWSSRSTTPQAAGTPASGAGQPRGEVTPVPFKGGGEAPGERSR